MSSMEAAQQPEHLRLERRRAHLLFASWRLSSSILRYEESMPLPAPAVPAQASNTDYVVARHAALLNGLTQQPGGCYAFLEEEGEGQPHLALHQIDVSEGNKPPQVHKVSSLPWVEIPAGGLSTGSLPPSVVEVQTAASCAEYAADGSNGATASSLLLVSSGQGDVSLVLRPAAALHQPSAPTPAAPVFPLRLAPPLRGVRPVHLLGAFHLPPGTGCAAAAEVCCILWAPRPRSNRQPSSCEVYAVRLAAPLAPAPCLHVEAVQLLKASDLPPHGALVNPASGSVLLVLQPSSFGVEEEEAEQWAAAAPAAANGSAGAMDEEDDASPRSLQAVVARLAAYTYDEPVGVLPHQQYADLYREAGTDGVGAVGAEPTCALYTFELAAEAAGAATAEAGGAAAVRQESQQPLLRLVRTLSCQPHKLLTCHLEQPAMGVQEPPTPDTHLLQGGGCEPPPPPCSSGSRLLLGLTDDVDCAVVAVRCRETRDASSRETGSSGGSGGEDGGRFVIEHVASVPAMAYVAAGKMQRKFLLLAPPGGDVACALVEAQQYAYLYCGVAPRQEYGEHQVVDMELPDSGRHGLLGAVLAGSRAGACRLLLLARDGLRVIDM